MTHKFNLSNLSLSLSLSPISHIHCKVLLCDPK
jgi:hypothetical protein